MIFITKSPFCFLPQCIKEVCPSVEWPCYLRVDLAGELQSPQVGSISTVILLHRMIGEAQSTRLCSVHHPSSKDELLSKRDTYHPGETLSPTCTHVTREEKPGWNLDQRH